MEMTHHTSGNVFVAKPLDQRLDARKADELKQQLTAFVEAGHACIALDLSAVEFIDSSGLGAIVAVLKRLNGHGHLVIVGARRGVVNLFQLTRMDKIFRMFGAEAEAVAALSN